MNFQKINEGVADNSRTFELINRGYSPDVYSAGQWFEVQEDEYFYFLECMPPMDFNGSAFSMREFSTGNLTNAFARFGDRFYCLTISRNNSADFFDQLSSFALQVAMKEAA